jgi:pimeloyl-ACP methyl ester carboxylesterase
LAEISSALYRAGHGEPLVLLHGFMGTWRHWSPVLADLVPRFEVIAPTLAGHDGGPRFEGDGEVTIAQGGDSLERHLDQLGVGTAHFVGNSMGGALAIELARRGRARSVVALAPAGGWRPESDEGRRLARLFTRQRWLARAAAPWLPTLARRPIVRQIAMRDVMRHGEQVAPPDVVDIARGSIRCAIFDRVLLALRSGSAVFEGLDQVAAPTLVAWPRHDHILPMGRHSHRFREEIPGVEYRVLEAVGHVPMWDDPRLVVDTIRRFAERHAAPAEAGARARRSSFVRARSCANSRLTAPTSGPGASATAGS